MYSRFSIHGGIAALCVLSFLLFSRPAEACDPLPCIRAAFAPRDGGVVPANGILAFRPPGSTITGNPPTGLAITRADGEVMEFDIEPDPRWVMGYLVRFRAEPAPGTYVATFPDRACFASEKPGADHVVTFSVIPAAELPISSGEGQAQPSVREDFPATATGTCFEWIDAAVSRIGVVPASSATPWGDVARYSLGLAGFREDRSFYGEPPSWQVYTACASTEPGIGRGVGEGVHQATVSLYLPGVDQPIPSSTFPVTLDCNAGDPSGEPGGPEPLVPAVGESGVEANATGCTTAGGAGLFALPFVLARLRRRR